MIRLKRVSSASSVRSLYVGTSLLQYASLLHRLTNDSSLAELLVEIQPVFCRKSPILAYPTCIWRPRFAPVNFRGDLWRRKTRLPGLSCGVVCVILRLAVLVEHRLVTDRDIDGHRPMASTAHA